MLISLHTPLLRCHPEQNPAPTGTRKFRRQRTPIGMATCRFREILHPRQHRDQNDRI